MKKFLLLTLLVISGLLHAENWTGTGWALKKGYIVTNFHCVDGAKSIVVETTESHYSAKVVATDPSSDLAIIKIDDDKFGGFGEIPYSIERKQCEVGETVWTLGFPMTSIMGDEVKFTDGKISAKTGYMGDLSTYQITVPIHPGNSGGPLFNKNGNIVGVTSSGLDKQLADNVNYAIKANYLLNLIESALSVDVIPNGSAKNLALTEYIRRNKKFVFLLHFSSELSANTIVDAEAQTSITQQEVPQPNNTSIELFEYVQIAEDKLEIKKYVGEWREVNIPSVVVQNGKKYSVTQIGEKAFLGCSFLTSIIIPQTISKIGSSAFENCTSLTTIDIPHSVAQIGNGAFKGCSSLKHINLSDNLTKISEFTFYGCNQLISINLPNSIVAIDKNAFSNCSSLTRIDIPQFIESIPDYCFVGCSSLKSVAIPKSVRSIGNGVFTNCLSLDSIIIPNSVINIGGDVFSGCRTLKNITLSENITSLKSGSFEGCASLEKILIPKKVTTLGDRVFLGCSRLNNIVIPNGVTSIGNEAFRGCICIVSITIPNGVVSIGGGCFAYCRFLESVVLSKNISSLSGNYSYGNQFFGFFEGCQKLKSIVIPESVTHLGKKTLSCPEISRH